MQNAANVSGKSTADVIREHLQRYMGPFTAKNAIQMFSKKTFGIDADSVTRAQAPALLEALGPMLRTLLGKNNAERVIEQLKQEFGV